MNSHEQHGGRKTRGETLTAEGCKAMLQELEHLIQSKDSATSGKVGLELGLPLNTTTMQGRNRGGHLKSTLASTPATDDLNSSPCSSRGTCSASE